MFFIIWFLLKCFFIFKFSFDCKWVINVLFLFFLMYFIGVFLLISFFIFLRLVEFFMFFVLLLWF